MTSIMLEDALRERSNLLDRILPNLFKSSTHPTEELIKRVCVHKELATTPGKITAVKSIKVDVDSVMERFAPSLNVIELKKDKLCPLTQAVVKKTWEGKCGHVFEEAAVLDYLKREVYCPVHGCNRKLI